MTTKIAALILAHHKPANLDRLLRRLSGELWEPYIHLDAKADISLYSPQVQSCLINERVDVRWGSWSQVRATLSLLDYAMQNSNVTHFYLLSGQCFPLRSDLAIANRISESQGSANFISLDEMPSPTKPMARLEEWHFRDVKPTVLAKAATRVAKALPKRNANLLLKGIKPYAGSSWWLLDRDAARSISEFLTKEPWVIDAFRFALCPDEMIFQTLFAHLGLTRVGATPTMAHWIQGRPNPEIVTAEIYEEMLSSDALFGRKFDTFYPVQA